MSEIIFDEIDAADFLKITPRQINALVKRREIPFITLPNGVVRFLRSRLREWAESLACDGGEVAR